MDTDIIFTRQKHDAKKAGLHYDYRIVVGDKAYSFATRKNKPEPGKKIILWEQPVHTRSYALSKKVEIPEGQYGAGTTVLDYVQKGKAQIGDDHYKLHLNNGESFTLKRMDPTKFGQGAWMFINTGKSEENA